MLVAQGRIVSRDSTCGNIVEISASRTLPLAISRYRIALAEGLTAA